MSLKLALYRTKKTQYQKLFIMFGLQRVISGAFFGWALIINCWINKTETIEKCKWVGHLINYRLILSLSNFYLFQITQSWSSDDEESFFDYTSIKLCSPFFYDFVYIFFPSTLTKSRRRFLWHFFYYYYDPSWSCCLVFRRVLFGFWMTKYSTISDNP